MLNHRFRSMRAVIIVSGCALGIAGIVYHQLTAGETRRNVDAQTILCKVLNPDGTPAAGVTVTALALLKEQRSRSLVTDRNGECRFYTGDSLPAATVDGRLSGVPIAAHGGAWAPAYGVAGWNETPGRPSITLQLRRPDTVTLKVCDDYGAPIRNLTVRVAAIGIGSAYMPIGVSGPGAQTGRTDSRGELRVERLPHGNRVIISTDDPAFVPSTPVDSIVLDGAGEYRKMIRLHAAGRISGRLVYAPDGRAADAVSVTVRYADPPYTCSTKTDPNGVYTFERLPPGQAHISSDIRRNGWCVAPVVCRVSAGRTSQAQLTVQKMGLLAIQVRDRSGLPAPGIVVDNILTDARGLAQEYVEPGKHEIIVGNRAEPTKNRIPELSAQGIAFPDATPAASSAAGMYADGLTASPPQSAPVTIRPGATARATIVVDVPASQNVEGMVTDMSGSPVAGALVHSARSAVYKEGIRTTDEWGRFDPDAGFATNGQCPWIAVTNHDGRFKISRVSNRCSLWASRGPTGGSREPVRAVPGQRCILEVHDAALGAVVATVRTVDGRPVTDAHIQVLRHYEHTRPFDSYALATTDRNGHFAIHSLPCGLKYSLRVSSESHGCAGVPAVDGGWFMVKPGEVRNLLPIVLPKTPRSIGGVVKDHSGSPVAFASVTGSGRITGIRHAMSDRKGRFKIARTAAEPIRLSATIDAPKLAHPDREAYGERRDNFRPKAVPVFVFPTRSNLPAPMRSMKKARDGEDTQENVDVAQVDHGMIVNRDDPQAAATKPQPDSVVALGGSSNVVVPLSPA